MVNIVALQAIDEDSSPLRPLYESKDNWKSAGLQNGGSIPSFRAKHSVNWGREYSIN